MSSGDDKKKSPGSVVEDTVVDESGSDDGRLNFADGYNGEVCIRSIEELV